MIRRKPAKYYPHYGIYAYTEWGFDHRVCKRLRKVGLSAKQIARIRDLYFSHKYNEHQDITGVYRNARRHRLYRLSRKLKGDRKQRLFELVERSEIFIRYYNEDGTLAGFASPRAAASLGVLRF